MYLQKEISKKTWYLEGHLRKEQDLDPDPLDRLRGTDHWILGSVPKCHGSGTVQNKMWTYPVYWPGLGDNNQSRRLHCIPFQFFLSCPHAGRLGRGQPTGVAAARDRRGRGAGFPAGARPVNPALPRPLAEVLAALTVWKLGCVQWLLTDKTAGGGGWLRGCRG